MPTVKDIIVRKSDTKEAQACKAWPIWTSAVCDFDWEYDDRETCLILEGQVTITDRPASGHSVSFGAGDLVVFPKGLKCIWKVGKPVRKHYNFG